MLRPAHRVLSDFKGVWHVSREITQANGPAAHFAGMAHWIMTEGGLSYEEAGTMTLAGQPPMAAERRYLWAEDLKVYFEDGRFFHQVPKEGGTAHHWCEPDSYTLDYDFSRWPEFSVEWRVQGPRKDYHAHTTYRRESG